MWTIASNLIDKQYRFEVCSGKKAYRAVAKCSFINAKLNDYLKCQMHDAYIDMDITRTI